MKSSNKFITLIVLLATMFGASVATASGASAEEYGPCEKGPYHNVSGSSMTASLPSEGGALSKICLSRRGDAGSGVSALQRAIKACYGLTIQVDGQFGSGTRSALMNVQRRIGAYPDGIYGPETMNRMYFPVNGSGQCSYTGASYDRYGWWPGP